MDALIFFIGLGLFILGLVFVIISFFDSIEAFIIMLFGFILMMGSDMWPESNSPINEPTKYEIITIKKLITPSDTTIKSIDTTYQKIN